MDVRFLNKLLDATAVTSDNDHTAAPRRRLNFAHTVPQRFGFLSDYGFREVESQPTIVRYRSGGLELNVYHGRESLEIAFQIGHHTSEQYSISEIVRVTDPEAGDRYRNATARTPAELVSAVDRLADFVSRYGERALRD